MIETTQLNSPAHYLKSATTQAHHDIESAMPVMRPDFNLEKYKVLLKKLYGFYASLEPFFLSHPSLESIGFDYASRKKLESLKRDLEFLGCEDLDSLPKKPLWMNRKDLSEALGTLYVLEGSTLGGQIISRHLRDRFQWNSNLGTLYFSGYGAQTGVMWKKYQSVLNTYLVSEDDMLYAAQAANSAFQHLNTWLKAES